MYIGHDYSLLGIENQSYGSTISMDDNAVGLTLIVDRGQFVFNLPEL